MAVYAREGDCRFYSRQLRVLWRPQDALSRVAGVGGVRRSRLTLAEKHQQSCCGERSSAT